MINYVNMYEGVSTYFWRNMILIGKHDDVKNNSLNGKIMKIRRPNRWHILEKVPMVKRKTL